MIASPSADRRRLPRDRPWRRRPACSPRFAAANHVASPRSRPAIRGSTTSGTPLPRRQFVLRSRNYVVRCLALVRPHRWSDAGLKAIRHRRLFDTAKTWFSIAYASPIRDDCDCLRRRMHAMATSFRPQRLRLATDPWPHRFPPLDVYSRAMCFHCCSLVDRALVCMPRWPHAICSDGRFWRDVRCNHRPRGSAGMRRTALPHLQTTSRSLRSPTSVPPNLRAGFSDCRFWFRTVFQQLTEGCFLSPPSVLRLARRTSGYRRAGTHSSIGMSVLP